MAMMEDDLEPLWDERPEEEDVFLPPYEGLRHNNQYLDKAAWIKLQIRINSLAFIEAVKRTLSHIHGGFISYYRVEKVRRNKYLLICTYEAIRDAAVREGPYTIPALGA